MDVSDLKSLFDEAEDYGHGEDRELVLFIDEFHQVVQLSAAAVEALKPVLAASGARGIKVIAATPTRSSSSTFVPVDLHNRSSIPMYRISFLSLSCTGSP